MRLPHFSFLARCCLLLLVFGKTASAAPAFDSLTPEEEIRVAQGEAIVHVEKTNLPLKHFLVVGQFNAPIRQVYRIFTDFEHYAEIFKLKDSRVVKRNGDTVQVRASMLTTWPIGDKWVTNETYLSPEDYFFSFHRIEGNIPQYDGSVKLIPKGPNACQVFYVAQVDPGIPFLPVWLLNQFQASMLPNTIRNVRDYLESHR